MAEKLPIRVDEVLAELALKHGIPPASEIARQKLASLGEQNALNILSKISRSSDIHNLSAYIMYMVEKEAIPAVNHPPACSSDEEPSSTGIKRWGTHLDEDLADSVRRMSELPVINEHLKALGKLDFRKAFLVLKYIGRYRLEEILSIKELNYLQDLEISRIESHLRQAVAIKVDSTSSFEEKILDWNKAHEYHCYVECNGSCVFKGPFSVERTNLLQRVIGESNVLQVHFGEELLSQQVDRNGRNQSASCKPNEGQIKGFQKIAKEGIFVGLRRYKFFGGSC